MEKGLKTLQSTARTAQRRASAMSQGLHRSFEDQGGISDHNSDSGIGLASDTEMEVGTDQPAGHFKSASWHAHTGAPQQQYNRHPEHQLPPVSSSSLEHEHVRSRSLPQPLPLYQPPLGPQRPRRTFEGERITESPQTMTFGQHAVAGYSRYSPDFAGRSGMSIQSVLSPAKPQHA
jgi:hypothetical protein